MHIPIVRRMAVMANFYPTLLYGMGGMGYLEVIVQTNLFRIGNVRSVVKDQLQTKNRKI